MTMKLNTTARTAMAAAILASLDADAAPATLKFYTGAQPAGPGVAVGAQVLLGTLVCSTPAGTAADGALTLGAIAQDNAADADGTATWARLADGAGNAVADFDVSNAAGAGSIKLNTTTIAQGGPILMTALVITMGGA